MALTDALVRAEQVFHHIDGLVLNAGILDPMGKIGDPPPVSEWKTHFDVNFFSLVTALKASLPALRKSDLGGRVVFVSSGSAVKSTSGWGPYSASKAALNSLCRWVLNFPCMRYCSKYSEEPSPRRSLALSVLPCGPVWWTLMCVTFI